MPFPKQEPRKWHSVSSLIEASRCQKLYQLSSVMRLTPKGGPHPALLFGEAIHKALGVWHGTYDFQLTMDGFLSVWKDAQGDDLRNIDTAVKVLTSYANLFREGMDIVKLLPSPKLPGTIQVQDTVSDFEVTFAIDIGLNLPFMGKIDALGEHRTTKELMIVEFKTARSVTSTLTNAFELSPQLILYSIAASAILGKPVNRCLLRAIQVAKTKCDIETRIIDVLPHHKEAALKWAQFWAGMVEHAESTGIYPENYSGCHPYAQFGQPGFSCKFLDLCKFPNPENLLGNYEVREQTPFILPETTE